MKKSLRNTALRNINRLVIATLNGDDWYAPDGHFAIKHDIYDGYKMKKDQTTLDGKPDLTPLLPPMSMQTVADVEYMPTTELDHEHYRVKTGEHKWRINADFYRLIVDIYPDHTVYADKDGYWASPTMIKTNDELVAVIMPMKDEGLRRKA